MFLATILICNQINFITQLCTLYHTLVGLNEKFIIYKQHNLYLISIDLKTL